jgi:hypothetical protein
LKYLLLLGFTIFTACGPTPGFNSIINIVTGAGNCPAGGYVLLSSLDTNRDGVVNDGDAEIKSNTVCNGNNATGVFSSVEVLDPCGDAPGVYDEVLLRLSDGTVLVSFSANASGDNTRFALIGPGTYTTTDGSNCTFTLTSEGRLQ